MHYAPVHDAAPAPTYTGWRASAPLVYQRQP